MLKSTRGFTIIEVFIAIITTVIVGFGVWWVYSANQSKVQTQNQAQTPATTPAQSSVKPEVSQNEGYEVIKEWSVRFKLLNNLANVEYQMQSKSDQFPDAEAVASFSTKEISAFGGRCDVKNGGAPLGQIVKSNHPLAKNPPIGDPLKIIGGKYYYYVSPQSLCNQESNQQLESLQLKTLNPQFKPSIETLEATK